MPEEYDVCHPGVVGHRQIARVDAAEKGMKTAVIDREYVAGSRPQNRPPSEQERRLVLNLTKWIS
jgi:hypothetical protein